MSGDAEDAYTPSAPQKKRFPRALLVVQQDDVDVKLDLLCALVSAGFVVEDCIGFDKALSKWRYAGFHDALFLLHSCQNRQRVEDDIHATQPTKAGKTAVAFAQEIRRSERTSMQSVPSPNGSPRRRKRTFVRASSSRASSAVVVSQPSDTVPRSFICGLYRNSEDRKLMEECDSFDTLLSLPLQYHEQSLRDRFVDLSAPMERLVRKPTHNEVLGMLSEMAMQHCSLLYPSLKCPAGTPSYGSTARSPVELEAQVHALELELDAARGARTEAEKETDAANQHAQALQNMLDSASELVATQKAQIEGLESLLCSKGQALEHQRRDFAALLKKLLPAEAAAKASQAIGVKPAEWQELHDIATENHSLREEIFSQQSELHKAKLRVSALEAQLRRRPTPPPNSAQEVKEALPSTALVSPHELRALGSSRNGGSQRARSAVQERLEQQLMEVHDAISFSAIHSNRFRLGLLTKPQRERLAVAARAMQEAESATFAASFSASPSASKVFRPVSPTKQDVTSPAALLASWCAEEASDSIKSEWPAMEAAIRSLEDASREFAGLNFEAWLLAENDRAALVQGSKCDAERMRAIVESAARIVLPLKNSFSESLLHVRRVIANSAVDAMAMFAAEKRFVQAVQHVDGASCGRRSGECLGVGSVQLLAHFSKHFHAALRGALHAALLADNKAHEEFTAHARASVAELHRVVWPLHQRIIKAEASGMMQQQRDAATLTDVS